MIGLTPHETELALSAGDPATGLGLAIAELSLYWDNHHKGAPEVRELRVNLNIADGDTAQRLATLQAIADWLGVEVHQRYGCHIAQRRFGDERGSVIVEAHCTPEAGDADVTRFLRGETSAQKYVEDRLAAIHAAVSETREAVA